MPSPTRRLLHAACALAVMGAYALPLSVGIASQVSHEIDHLVDELRGREPGAVRVVDGGGGAGAGGFVHAHGDVTAHAHEGGIAKLLVAAEHTQQQQSDAAVVALELVGHVPAAAVPAVFFAVDAAAAAQAPHASGPGASLRPPLPPPRRISLTA